MQVRPTMTVAELIQVAPQVVAFFMERRLHCVGCHLDTFCTLEQVAANYNLPNLLTELQAFLDAVEPPSPQEGDEP